MNRRMIEITSIEVDHLLDSKPTIEIRGKDKWVEIKIESPQIALPGDSVFVYQTYISEDLEGEPNKITVFELEVDYLEELQVDKYKICGWMNTEPLYIGDE